MKSKRSSAAGRTPLSLSEKEWGSVWTGAMGGQRSAAFLPWWVLRYSVGLMPSELRKLWEK